jgi:hypothetical protein
MFRLTVPFFLLMSAVAVPTPVTSSRVAVAHDTSAVNCTEAECAYDVKVCNKASDSCKRRAHNGINALCNGNVHSSLQRNNC